MNHFTARRFWVVLVAPLLIAFVHSAQADYLDRPELQAVVRKYGSPR